MIFRKGNISALFDSAYVDIKKIIEGETDDYILNVNESEYSAHLINKYKLTAPEIHFDQVYADGYEREIPAEYFPGSFDVHSGRK